MINFIRNNTAVVVGIIVFVLMNIGIIYTFEKQHSSCSQVIFLEGELSRDINYVDYLSHGNIAQIHYCDGKVEEVPTSKIIKVVFK
jgi:hypothetical protein